MVEAIVHPPQPRRRWFQFRLRTMLVAVSLLCAALAWYTQRVQRQKRAVELIAAANGEVYYEFERSRIYENLPDSPKWAPQQLVDLFGNDFFYEVRGAWLAPNFAGKDKPPSRRILSELEALASLPTLEHLALDEILADQEEIAAIGRLTQLEHLILRIAMVRVVEDRTEYVDPDLRALGGLTQLRGLNLVVDGIADDDLVHIKEMRQLEYLELDGRHLSDEGLVHLHTLTQLKYLELPSKKRFTDAGVAELRKALPHAVIIP